MQTVITIGLDIAKSVFQVHGIDAEGKVIIRRQLKRRYVQGKAKKGDQNDWGTEQTQSLSARRSRRTWAVDR
jgi:transposase